MTLTPGADLGPSQFPITRADLVRYAGASGDFNPIHWSERVATDVGLPGVLAHGMFTMALAGRALSSWLGPDDRLVSFGVRFSKPVVVPDDDAGVALEVTGVATEGEEGRVRVDLTVTVAGEKVLGQARAEVAPGA
ncbi:MAG: MaoC/PaaZ C-terminal domain-containing protein [Nocardioidaceae bacterium]|nr:MaoC/PaaZ C-terminal domain-containing protein [Nocardioidaceae bacterium]